MKKIMIMIMVMILAVMCTSCTYSEKTNAETAYTSPSYAEECAQRIIKSRYTTDFYLRRATGISMRQEIPDEGISISLREMGHELQMYVFMDGIHKHTQRLPRTSYSSIDEYGIKCLKTAVKDFCQKYGRDDVKIVPGTSIESRRILLSILES